MTRVQVRTVDMGVKIARQRFALGTIGAFASLGQMQGRAAAADFSLKFATSEPAGTPLTVRALQAFTRIRNESKGRVDIQLFPGNALGGNTSMMAQMRTGAITFVPVDGITLSSVVPVAAILGVGFAFNTIEHGFTAFDGDLGAYVRREILAKGIYAHERMLAVGTRDITTTPRAIQTPDDLHGLRIRTLPGKLSVDLLKTLGASAVAMDSSETYTALQTHLIDGEETALLLIQIDRYYEVQKYLSMTAHQWGAFWICGHLDTWNSIPADLQGIISRNFALYSKQQRRDVELHSNVAIDYLTRRGMVVNHPDRAPFRATLGPFYARWKAEFGDQAWSLLEKYSGKLA